MNRSFYGSLQSILFFTDLLIVISIFELFALFSVENDHTYYFYIGSLILSSIWLLCSYILGLYRLNILIGLSVYLKKLIRVLLIFVLLIFLFRKLIWPQHAMINVIEYLTLFIITITAIKTFIYKLIFKLASSEKYSNRLLVIGWNETSRKLIDWLNETKWNDRIIGIISDQHNQTGITDSLIIKQNLKFFTDIDLGAIHEIYSTLSPEEIKPHYDLSHECRSRGIRLHWVSRFQEKVPYPIFLHQQAGVPVFSELNEPLLQFSNRMVKRVFDISFSVLMITLCLSWMIPILGLLIVIESPGPVFFRQRRTGINNRDFICYKLRTMRVNHHADEKQAEKNDVRITRLGKFLRHTSLDEFPQFINVLLGQMSIVGPRPHMLKHTEKYSSLYGTYRVRHYVKPGITGWAQVNGCRGEIAHPDQLKARIVRDIWYIENWSFLLDVKILMLTLHKMLVGDQHAY